ncbi:MULTISPECIES: transcriptional regulator [unclassified Bacillus (in: firmicutes)]|uniref:transcriptional regulator n=1 Tax=unclassified Bacillus (in: firmicutes) TaxID=185979 RepID=UPI00211D6BB9|nr:MULTISPECIES: transcriptional regulator [unclassified Bacillus (in: firmicutes)]
MEWTMRNIIILVLVFIVLITQSIMLFTKAKKRNRSAWLWGLLGIIQFPWPSIFFYFLVVRKDRKKLI